MGKNTGSSTTSTKYELSPEQRQIMQATMKTYMPGGQLPSASPKFDYNTNADLQSRAQNYVAPFSEPTKQAFAATEANFGAQQPAMDLAKGMTVGAGQHAGMFQNAPDGWSVGDDGTAKYQDFTTGVNKYMNPFTNMVIGNGLDLLNTARARQELATNADSVAKGSFGGTRQAVRNGIDDTGYAAQSQKLISDNLNTGYNNAVNQYNTGFGQGQQALNYNTGIEQADRSALLGSSAQLANQAEQNQRITGNDINALASVGDQIQNQDQTMRDAARASQLQDETYGLNIAQAVSGFTPPPSSTSTTTQSVPSSSIWGTIGSAAANMGMAAMSDEKSKTNVKDADPEDALAQIRKLKPKTFEYKPLVQASHGVPAGRRTGFMAQDLEKATGNKNPVIGGYQHVDTHELMGRLVHAVQALDAKYSRGGGARKAA